MLQKFYTASARISAEEKEKLDRYCKENDETISRVLRKLLREFLKSQ